MFQISKHPPTFLKKKKKIQNIDQLSTIFSEVVVTRVPMILKILPENLGISKIVPIFAPINDYGICKLNR